MSDATVTTRRSALGKLGLLAAGAIGVGYAAREATDAAPAARPRPEPLTLRGREFRLHSPARVAGEKPPPGDRPTPQGRLVDGRDRPIGEFRSALLPAMTALELHTFDLVDGQIFGVGAPRPGIGTFAVIGGTGRYAGASGSYVATQSLRELGGDGTAEFRLILDNLEA